MFYFFKSVCCVFKPYTQRLYKGLLFYNSVAGEVETESKTKRKVKLLSLYTPEFRRVYSFELYPYLVTKEFETMTNEVHYNINLRGVALELVKDSVR